MQMGIHKLYNKYILLFHSTYSIYDYSDIYPKKIGTIAILYYSINWYKGSRLMGLFIVQPVVRWWSLFPFIVYVIYSLLNFS